MNSNIPTNSDRLSIPEIEQVRQALSERFSGVEVRLEGPISVGENSEIFHAFIATPSPLQAAVKRCIVTQTGEPDVAEARAQFAALERVNSAMRGRNNRCQFPAPICLITELATVAMTWIEGESLTNKMRRLAIFSEGRKWFKDSGAWLGNFHSAGPVRRRTISLDDRLNVIRGLHRSHLNSLIFARAFQLLQETAQAISCSEANTSWLHGDCKTDNFILFGDTIYGIDISLSFENPIEYDLAQFLNNLELTLSAPQYLHLRWLQPRLEDAFWLGYRQTGPAVAEPYLQWLRLNFALCMWRKQPSDPKHSARTWIRQRMLSKLVNRLSKNFLWSLR